jgi:hypothetical protein
MSLPPLLWPTLALLVQAGAPAEEAARPEYSVLRPLLIALVAVGLLIGLLRFFWRNRGGGRPG